MLFNLHRNRFDLEFLQGMKQSSLGEKAYSKVRRLNAEQEARGVVLEGVTSGETSMSSIGMSKSSSKSMRSPTLSMMMSSASKTGNTWPMKSNRASAMAVILQAFSYG